MIEQHPQEMSVSRQCELLGIHRSGLYYTAVAENAEHLMPIRKIDKQYFRTPFYDVRRVTERLKREGHTLNYQKGKVLDEYSRLANDLSETEYELEKQRTQNLSLFA